MLRQRSLPSLVQLSPVTSVALVFVMGSSGGVERHVLDLARSLPQEYERFIITAEGGWLHERALAAGLSVEAVPEPRGNFDLHTTRGIGRILRRRRPDIVHSHLARSDWYVWLASHSSPGLVLVSTEHGISGERPDLFGNPVSRWLHGFGHQLRLHRTATTIAVSNETARVLQERYRRLRRHPPVVVRPGVDTHAFAVVPNRSRLPGAPLRVVCLARLAPEKGVDVLVRATARARASGTHLHVVIAGDGPERERIQRLVIEEGVGDAVTLVGRVEDTRSLLADADLLVLPSRSENLPLAALEALASGIPVVASSVGGVAEVVDDGVNGWLTPPDDAQALADLLCRLDVDPDALGDAAASALVRRESFGLKRMAEETARVYAQVV